MSSRSATCILLLATIVVTSCLVPMDGWHEISDSIPYQGQSVAAFKTQTIQNTTLGFLFTLLVPCELGASFAGIIKPAVALDWSTKSDIVLKVKGHGAFKGYEFILRHNGEDVYSYVSYFQTPFEAFGEVRLPLDGFKTYRQGVEIQDTPLLNKGNVTSVGILAYGGIHRKEKQTGAAALAIEWIHVE